MQDIAAVAKALFSAIERGDLASLRQIYAPDVEIWHNTDGIVQTLDENLVGVQAFMRHVSDRRFEDAKLDVFADGFVQRHRVTGVRADGRKVGFEACIVTKIKNGKIVHLSEYFDSAAVSAAMA